MEASFERVAAVSSSKTIGSTSRAAHPDAKASIGPRKDSGSTPESLILL